MAVKIEDAMDYLSAGFSIIPLLGKRNPWGWNDFRTRFATKEEVALWFGNQEKVKVLIIHGGLIIRCTFSNGANIIDDRKHKAIL